MNILVSFFFGIILFSNTASAMRNLEVVLYCSVPNAACDMAQSRLDSVHAHYAIVRTWEDQDSRDEYDLIVDTYGLNPATTQPVTVIEDSIVVGVDGIVPTYNLVRSNR